MKCFLLPVIFLLSVSTHANHWLGCGPALQQRSIPLINQLSQTGDTYLSGSCWFAADKAAATNRWLPGLPSGALQQSVPSTLSSTDAPSDSQYQSLTAQLPLLSIDSVWLSLIGQYHYQRLPSSLRRNSYWSLRDQVIAAGQRVLVEDTRLNYAIEAHFLRATPLLNTLGLAIQQRKQPITLKQTLPGDAIVLTPVLYRLHTLYIGHQRLLRGWNVNWQLTLGQGELTDNGVQLLETREQNNQFQYLALQLELSYRWRFSRQLHASVGYQADGEYINSANNKTAPYQIDSQGLLHQQLVTALEWRF